MRFFKCDPQVVRVVIMTDAAISTDADHTSHLRVMIFLVDDFHRSNVLHYSFRKSLMVTCSVHADELFAAAQGFDIVSMLLQAQNKNTADS